MNEDLKKFSASFFHSLGAVINMKENLMEISKVPEVFEKFYGKKSPYLLAFVKEEAPNSEIEFIGQGSFLLSCMKEFLSGKGETTLLKLDINPNPAEVLKKKFFFKQCDISGITKIVEYKILYRFTFITNFQYLNEKEQLANSVMLKNSEIIDLDLKNYGIIEGKKEEIRLEDVKKFYEQAKTSIKPSVTRKIEEIGNMLDSKLKKEIERIKNHYANQEKERQDVLQRTLKHLTELEKDPEKNQQKILKSKETLALINDEKKVEQTKKEEQFLIADETQKHSLNIETKLMNTSIIYYPVFTYAIAVKGKNSSKLLSIKHNPLENTLSEVSCDSCKKSITRLNICSSGHLSCDSCFRGCSQCNEDYCLLCLKNECFSCGRKLCKKCAKKCLSCSKIKCSSHMATNSKCLTCKAKLG